MGRKFWHMQLHPGNEGENYPPDRIKEILNKYKVIGFDIWDEPLIESGLRHLVEKPFTEWQDEEIEKAKEASKRLGTEGTFGIIKAFIEDVKIGDIVLIRKREVPIALVEIASNYFMDPSKGDDGQPWFRHRRKVKILGFFSEDKEKLGLNLETLPIGKPTKTLQKLEKPGPIKKFLEDWLYKKLPIIILESVSGILQVYNQIILYGPPGSGKTHLAKSIAKSMTDKENTKLIQFHPSYTYEDFVRGIEVKTINGQPVYETKNKIFAQICEIAKANPDKKFVLIIDEINRSNLPAVLGELIYALEYRGEPVETPYEINGDRTLIVPENLYIIGTMNTADRSVGHIDYAIRRRFIFYPVRANKDMIDSEKARELYESVIENIFKKENMSPEFKDKVEDVKIGHTYFLGDTEEVAYKFVYQVIPLLIEYIRDGILKNEEVVGEAFKDYFGSEGENWKELDIETVKQKLQ